MFSKGHKELPVLINHYACGRCPLGRSSNPYPPSSGWNPYTEVLLDYYYLRSLLLSNGSAVWNWVWNRNVQMNKRSKREDGSIEREDQGSSIILHRKNPNRSREAKDHFKRYLFFFPFVFIKGWKFYEIIREAKSDYNVTTSHYFIDTHIILKENLSWCCRK